jgi:hypothetical protein
MSDTMHDLIAELGRLKEEKRRHEFNAKKVGKQIELQERRLIDEMDAQKITEQKSAAGKVTLSEAVYPQVQDWDAVYKFIHDNEYFHCLEKRFAVLAYREFLGQGKTVPGVVPHTKRKVSFKEI